jgi:IS605 OrfB family transposase
MRGKSPLGSQMVCQAIKSVAGKYKALKLKKKDDIPVIEFKPKSIHYDKRTYTIKDQSISLATLEKRIVIPMVFGRHQRKLYDSGVAKEAELINRKKQWFFNLVLDLPDVSVTGNSKVIGVDLGENNIAATSTGKLIGGGKLRYDRDRFLALRRRLQRNGSESAKQKLKDISGKEARHVKHVNHEVANQIVSEAVKSGAGVIAMENLTNIRQRIKAGKRVRARLHRWSWYQLQQFVEYKSVAVGIEVIFVNPAYSSKTCNACGQIAKRNKHSLVCACGNRAHSDLNASRNIARLGGTAVSLRVAVNRPNVAA